MKYKSYIVMKLILIVASLGVSIFLIMDKSLKENTLDQSLVFVIDINHSMNVRDVRFGSGKISRLDAVKFIITKIVLFDPKFSYGLVIFNESADYFLPPTFDTGTFLLYLSGISTNLLPEGNKNFSSLSSFLKKTNTLYTRYIIFSDFDVKIQQNNVIFPSLTMLCGIGTDQGDVVRYPNMNIIRKQGKIFFSIRNDKFARALGLPYIILSDIENVPIQKLIYHSFVVFTPVQRLWMYALLGVLVILAMLI